MNAGLISAFVILVACAQASAHGVQLSVRLLTRLLIGTFCSACLTLLCTSFVLQPLASVQLTWLIAALLAGAAATWVAAAPAAARGILPMSADVAAANSLVLWQLSACSSLAVLLVALPDPFIALGSERLNVAAGIARAAASTALIGGTLLLIGSALHQGVSASRAFVVAAVLGMAMAGVAGWLPDVASSELLADGSRALESTP